MENEANPPPYAPPPYTGNEHIYTPLASTSYPNAGTAAATPYPVPGQTPYPTPGSQQYPPPSQYKPPGQQFPPAAGQAPYGQPPAGYAPQPGYGTPQYVAATPPQQHQQQPQPQQVVVVTAGQPQQTVNVQHIKSYSGHMFCSCIVFLCFNPPFGLIAFILAGTRSRPYQP